MGERTDLLIDALDHSVDEFERVWDELQATPEDLENLLRELTPGMTDTDRSRHRDLRPAFEQKKKP